MAEEVIVFGANGLLGATLCPQLAALGWHVLRQSRGKDADVLCDPSDLESVRAAINRFRPVSIVNLVANSDVDYCQNNLSDAYLANVRTVEVISSIIQEMESMPHLIQISTDHLYSGMGPHNERDVMPVNTYALSKFAGELFAVGAGATVIRTNFFGLSQANRRHSFTDWIFRSLLSGTPFTVFEDVQFSPLHMERLAEFISRAIELRRPGVFNVGSKNGFSKAEFAMQFARGIGLDTSHMNVGSVKDLSLASPRPQDMRMNVTAFETAFDVVIPSLENQISYSVEEYRSKVSELRG